MKIKKKTKKILKYSIILICIFLFIISFYCYNYFPLTLGTTIPYSSTGEPIFDITLTKNELKEDVNQIITTIEDTHPIFLETVPNTYFLAKENLIKNTKKEMTVKDFSKEILKYLSTLNDGHTTIRTEYSNTLYLDILWKFTDNKLILLDNNLKETEYEVIKIADKNISDLIGKIETLFPAENYIGKNRNIENKLKESLILEFLGIPTNKSVKLTIKEPNGEYILDTSFINYNLQEKYDHAVKYEKLNDDIFYIDLGVCSIDSMNKLINEAIQEEVAKGTKNFIIDVRDNPGGNSSAVTSLLDSLGMEYGNFGTTMRYSSLAKQTYGYIKEKGFLTYESFTHSANPNNINLYVISNQNTFSSAQFLVTLVHDSQLGKIVGQPGYNSPSCFGDILNFQLKNSLLEGIVSYKKWLRPDASKNSEKFIEPDIKTTIDENPIDIVIQDINNK